VENARGGDFVGPDPFNREFWRAVDELRADTELIIDRPRGTCHPRYPGLIYPVDYGYLKDTASMDGGGIDVWRGSEPAGRIDALICTVDLKKRDSEIKLLLGCTEAEKEIVYRFHNEGSYMKGIMIRREDV
jgi:inorganic pyrophosphatase